MMNEILEQVPKNVAVAADGSTKIRRIVVPIDLSAHSKMTASYAVALAMNFGASITFVHVFPTQAISIFTAQDGLENYERERDLRKKELARFVDRIRESYSRCETEFRIGDAAEEIRLTALEVEADLIITASCHPAKPGCLFGLDQAKRIVNQAPCSVLVYQEPNERELYGRYHQ
jgi:nucleotide-binding universal stress UspA family protein